ncbi:MAG: cysteine synthase A, partial [Pseudohongiellaceae bacterium]
RVSVIEALGATIVPISAEQGGFVGSIAQADAYAASHPSAWRPQQFSNPDNAEVHQLTTGPDLLAQLRSVELLPTGFVAGVGTGGTVMGVGRALREVVPEVAIHPLEPANSPTLRTGKRAGCHRIQGISDEFIPELLKLDTLDSLIDVDDGGAILMAQKLASELGLAVGISSGANLLGALMVAHEQGPEAVVATVFADSNKKYLTTDLCRVEPPKAEHLSPQVELLGFTVIERHCCFC